MSQSYLFGKHGVRLGQNGSRVAPLYFRAGGIGFGIEIFRKHGLAATRIGSLRQRRQSGLKSGGGSWIRVKKILFSRKI